MAEFSPILSKVQVETAVITCLQNWYSWVLADIEDVQPNLAKGQLGRPQTWQSDVDVRKLPERQIPAVVCVVGEGDPVFDGQYIHMHWPLVVGLITKGKNRQQGRDVVGHHGSAILATVMWKLTSYAPIQSVKFEGIGFGEHAGDPGTVGADVQVSFTVFTPNVIDLRGGPPPTLLPPDVPPDVPEWPENPDDPTVADEDYNPAVEIVSKPYPEEFDS